MSSQALRFYFDYISNNAYLAWTQLPRLAERYDLTIEPVPVLFAGLLAANHQLGPAEVRPKAIWMGRNVLRKAALLGVPLQAPAHHPYNPLPSLRASLIDMPAAARQRLIDGLFRALWAESRHIAEDEVVADVATSAGLDGADLIAQTHHPETKARLRSQTDEAIAAGVFGVPTMVVAGELFFGYDDFPYLEMVLAGNDPLDPESLAGWNRTAVTASAHRRQFRELLEKDEESLS